MIGEREIKILMGNFRRSSAYFRGIDNNLNSLFGKAPHTHGHNIPKFSEKPTGPIGVEDCICYQTSYSISFKFFILGLTSPIEFKIPYTKYYIGQKNALNLITYKNG